jgi:uncharacterized protein
VPHRPSIAALALAGVLVSMPARAQTIDPEFRADIEKLFEVTGAGSLGSQMAELVSNSFLDAMRQAQPDVSERAVAVVRETLTAEFAKGFEPKGELMTRMAGIYATNFSHAEVRALLAFYATDVGRKSISVMPTLAQQGAAAGRQWAEQNMPRVIQALELRLREENLFK